MLDGRQWLDYYVGHFRKKIGRKYYIEISRKCLGLN